MKVTNTIYKKGKAESSTETDANGNSWEINTWKTNSGKIECTAIQGKSEQKEGYKTFSYDMFGGKRLRLASKEGRATDKTIQEVHAAGLLKFAEEMEKEEAAAGPLYIIEVGQVFFSDGIESKTNRRAVYQIKSPGNYMTVTLDGQHMRNDTHVKPYGEKFGIGTYYNEGDKIPAAEVEELLIKAREADRQRKQAAEKASTAAAIERNQKIAAGIKIIAAIPAYAKAVIVAELKENTSDIMTDYHGHTVEKVIYLAWSEHTRDIFSEMRKAAGKFEGTKHLEKAPEKPAEAGEFWSAPDEHREKYSMGSGYYLSTGHSNASGWSVSKENLPSLEALQIAAAECRFLCNTQPEAATEAYPYASHADNIPAGEIQIIDYSEKAIAIIGDTKPIKDKLKNLGGKFNARLTCGAGWIFRKTDLQKVTEALSKTPDPETIQDEPTAEEAEAIAEETRAPLQLEEHTAKKYNNLEDIDQAANSGEIIDLTNLYELVNSNKPAAEAMREGAKALQAEAEKPHAEEVKEKLRATANKLQEMATEHRAVMEVKRAEIQQEANKFFEELDSRHPLNICDRESSQYKEALREYKTMEDQRKESDQRRAGRVNTALPAPQMFLSF